MMLILILKKTKLLFKLTKDPNPSVKERGVQATNSKRLSALLQFDATFSMPKQQMDYLLRLEQTC